MSVSQGCPQRGVPLYTLCTTTPMRHYYLVMVTCSLHYNYAFRISPPDNLCCSFPCEHNGICITKGFNDYVCDCTRTGYYGKHCERCELCSLCHHYMCMYIYGENCNIYTIYHENPEFPPKHPDFFALCYFNQDHRKFELCFYVRKCDQCT